MSDIASQIGLTAANAERSSSLNGLDVVGMRDVIILLGIMILVIVIPVIVTCKVDEEDRIFDYLVRMVRTGSWV